MFVLCLVTSSGKLWNYIQKPIITYQFTYQIRLCCWSTPSPKNKKNKNFPLSPLSPQRFIVGCLGFVCICRWLCHPAERRDEHPAGHFLQPDVCLILLHWPGLRHPAGKQLCAQRHLCHCRRDVPLHRPGWYGTSLFYTVWTWLTLKHQHENE